MQCYFLVLERLNAILHVIQEGTKRIFTKQDEILLNYRQSLGIFEINCFQKLYCHKQVWLRRKLKGAREVTQWGGTMLLLKRTGIWEQVPTSDPQITRNSSYRKPNILFWNLWVSTYTHTHTEIHKFYKLSKLSCNQLFKLQCHMTYEVREGILSVWTEYSNNT